MLGCKSHTGISRLTGLKITAGHRTMSGQDNYLSGQNVGFGGHFDRPGTWFPKELTRKKLFALFLKNINS